MNLLKGKVLWILIIVATLSVWIGFAIGRWSKNAPTSQSKTTSIRRNVNPLFSSQTASIRGQIIGVDGTKLRVKNINGREDSVDTAQKIIIKELDGGTKTASGSAEFNKITLNKDALIILQLQQNFYRVASITYVTPPPPLVVATSSATTNNKNTVK